MTATTAQQHLRNLLKRRYGGRFRPGERGPLVGIVWPETEQELRVIVADAAEAEVPVVPRGAGSSPYGGSLAVRGLIVAFDRLNEIRDVDPSQQLATVQAGTIWQAVIERTSQALLMPRVYPSSRTFATVGGFVAQGGVGIGSFEFGAIDEHVAAARLIDARGEVLQVTPDQIPLVVGAEGRTGLISEVTLRLQPLHLILPTLGLFQTAAQVEDCLNRCVAANLPLWSVNLLDANAAEVHSDVGGPRQPPLPPGYFAALFGLRDRDVALLGRLIDAIRHTGGSLIAEQATMDRWLDRFMSLQVLHTTPIPMQFRLPATRFSQLLDSLPASTRARVGLEATVADHGRHIIVRFFLLTRPLTAAENLDVAYEFLGLVRLLGGEIYSTGAFFLDEAGSTFGSKRLAELKKLHGRYDPHDLLNPGKAFRS